MLENVLNQIPCEFLKISSHKTFCQILIFVQKRSQPGLFKYFYDIVSQGVVVEIYFFQEK
jgi:hypothetical protein